MLSLIRPPNGITERAREVLALLCNPTLYTRHTASNRPPPPAPPPSLPHVPPQFACIHTDTGGYSIGFRLPWSVLVGEGCGRRLGDLRSDFKLYLGMDRSIYLGGVSAIMHGLTVSVAAKLTPLRRAAMHFSLSLSLYVSFFRSSGRTEKEEERNLEFRIKDVRLKFS